MVRLPALAKTGRVLATPRLESGIEITCDDLALIASRALRLPECEKSGQINKARSDERSKEGVDVHWYSLRLTGKRALTGQRDARLLSGKYTVSRISARSNCVYK